VEPPFNEFHFIDLDGDKTDALQQLAEGRQDVHVHKGDCNGILLDSVFPRANYEDYRRALCLLDPYGLHLDWRVIQTAGRMRSVEIFLNFPVMDMNRNVLWHDAARVDKEQIERMDAFWGDGSWRTAAYTRTPGLFEDIEEKAGNEIIAEAFRQRLIQVAGFACVPEPMPMRNAKGAVVYYLFFASPNKTGAKIVTAIFNKYRNRGAV